MAWGTERQREQWKLRHALAYTGAIRGYLLCWKELLKAAGVETFAMVAIDRVLDQTVYLQNELRVRLATIKQRIK